MLATHKATHTRRSFFDSALTLACAVLLGGLAFQHEITWLLVAA